MPRRYDMSKRRAAVAETKRRIAEATMELHNSQGPLATSWEQIAERADVSPATVYRHFPSYEELLPACGELSFEKLALPTEGDLSALLADEEDPRERLRILVDELYAMYERAGSVIWAVRRDRSELAQLQDAHELIEGRIGALIALALEPLDLDAETIRVVRALTDFHAWSAMRDSGLEPERARAEAVALLAPRLGLGD